MENKNIILKVKYINTNRINSNTHKWHEKYYTDASVKPRENFGYAELSNWQVHYLNEITKKLNAQELKDRVKETLKRKVLKYVRLYNVEEICLGSLLSYRQTQIPEKYLKSEDSSIDLEIDDVFIKTINPKRVIEFEEILDKIPGKSISNYAISKRVNSFKNKNIAKLETILNTFSLLNINLNGLTNKKLQLEAVLVDLKPDIVFIQETKRQKTAATLATLAWGGYTIIEKHATEEIAKNGMIIAARRNIMPNTIIECINDFYIKISILGADKQK